MKAIIAKIKIHEGKEHEFEQIGLKLAREVETKEPGNSLYKLCKSAAGDYFFIELYESIEAMAEHGAATHMQQVGPKFFSLMDGGPEITIVDVLGY